MNCFTNAGGGGSASAWAYISVTYPSGSTCSATNGTITLTAKGTSGLYVFGIPEPTSTPETWTVSCTDGIRTRSETVVISEQYQCANIQLIYGRLPVEYQEVEYLESSGTQYVNVGLISNFANYEIDLTYMSFGGVASVTCGGGGQSMVYFGQWNNSTQKIQYQYYNIFNSNKGINTKITVEINNSNNQIVEDGSVIATNVGLSGLDRYFGLFCVSRQSGVENISSARIYACTIIDKSTDTAVYDFVPCYRRADSVAGFYDLANNEFLTNDGTGTFVVGSDV